MGEPVLITVWRPIISHVMDAEKGRTLCGVEVKSDWCEGGWIEPSEMVGCIRCNAALEKMAAMSGSGSARE